MIDNAMLKILQRDFLGNVRYSWMIQYKQIIYFKKGENRTRKDRGVPT